MAPNSAFWDYSRIYGIELLDSLREHSYLFKLLFKRYTSFFPKMTRVLMRVNAIIPLILILIYQNPLVNPTILLSSRKFFSILAYSQLHATCIIFCVFISQSNLFYTHLVGQIFLKHNPAHTPRWLEIPISYQELTKQRSKFWGSPSLASSHLTGFSPASLIQFMLQLN